MAEQAVVLTNPAATERISSNTTDVDGTFRFETLPPADYRITLEIPDTFQRTNDDSFLVTVTTDGSIPELAFGIAGR